MAKKRTQKYQADGFALTFVSFENLSRFSLHSALVVCAELRICKHGFVGSNNDPSAKWKKCGGLAKKQRRKPGKQIKEMFGIDVNAIVET